jgi:very-short-patch-repair endonuclease
MTKNKHSHPGWHQKESSKELIGLASKKMWSNKKLREKILANRKPLRGKANGFYGQHHTDVNRKIISSSSTKMWENTDIRKKIIDSHRYPRSVSTKKKIKKGLMGHEVSAATRLKLSISNKGKPGFWKGKKLSREHIRKMLRRRHKSSLELKFETLIKKYDTKLKFVGNGKFFVDNINPDFVDKKKKLVIETFYRAHKLHFRGGTIEDYKKERTEICNKNNFNILFFDETEVNDECVRNKLLDYYAMEAL